VSKPSRNLAFLLLLAVALSPRLAEACSVPVFRYALDRWTADAFRLEAPSAALRTGPAGADLRGDNGVRLNLLAVPQSEDAGGKATLRFPAEVGDAPDAWTGELTPAVWKQLTESPARTELVHRLLAGDSAVWILVESGHRDVDDQMATLLTEQMAVAQRIPLPATRPNDPSSQIGPGPELRVKFSLLRISRDAADEAFFITSLAGPGGVDSLPKDQPFATLVFGRGRVLGAWSPPKLSPELIQQASRFLLGACSCEAKHLNPGWDLLMRVNWDAELERVAASRPSSPAATRPAAKPDVVVYEAAPATNPAEPTRRPFVFDQGMIVGMVAGVLVIATLAFFVMRRRS
jgi:hypothetical protein